MLMGRPVPSKAIDGMGGKESLQEGQPGEGGGAQCPIPRPCGPNPGRARPLRLAPAFYKCSLKQAHWSGWDLPRGKRMSVPLPRGEFQCTQICTGCSQACWPAAPMQVRMPRTSDFGPKR